MIRTSLKLALLAGLGLGFAGAVYTPPAEARTHVTVSVNLGVVPPPLRFERTPPPRRGHVWAPGYWQWNAHGRRHTWVAGHWVQSRPSYRHQPTRWTRHHKRQHAGYRGR